MIWEENGIRLKKEWSGWTNKIQASHGKTSVLITNMVRSNRKYLSKELMNVMSLTTLEERTCGTYGVLKMLKVLTCFEYVDMSMPFRQLSKQGKSTISFES